MAELPASGKFHEVDDAEADAVIEAASHGLLHNEAVGRIVRNMYKRIQVLEDDLKAQKMKAEKPKRSGSP
jgi:hypothetical protein